MPIVAATTHSPSAAVVGAAANNFQPGAATRTTLLAAMDAGQSIVGAAANNFQPGAVTTRMVSAPLSSALQAPPQTVGYPAAG